MEVCCHHYSFRYPPCTNNCPLIYNNSFPMYCNNPNTNNGRIRFEPIVPPPPCENMKFMNICPPKTKHSSVQISLNDKKLWSLFHEVSNEMIVTRDGRRTFPVLKINVQGLEENKIYKVELDFHMTEPFRFKYMKGGWVPGSSLNVSPVSTSYNHPDSPNLGKFWMSNTISFSRLKITNKPVKDCTKVNLHTMFRYIPRIHIKKVENDSTFLIGTYYFEETEFIAVTAYQNDLVTALKVKYNPFAKAFFENKNEPSPSCSNNSTPTDQREQNKFNSPLNNSNYTLNYPSMNQSYDAMNNHYRNSFEYYSLFQSTCNPPSHFKCDNYQLNNYCPYSLPPQLPYQYYMFQPRPPVINAYPFNNHSYGMANGFPNVYPQHCGDENTEVSYQDSSSNVKPDDPYANLSPLQILAEVALQDKMLTDEEFQKKESEKTD